METAKAIVVRNSRVVIAGMLIFAVASVLIGVLSAIEACHQLFQLHGHIFIRVLNGIQWAAASLGLTGIGAMFWRQARKSGFSEVRLENEGAHFRFGSRKKTFDAFLAWKQISSVIVQSRPNNQYVFVSGKNGTQVNYTAYDIFRYKKLAREIASRAGFQLTILKPARRRAGKLG